MSRRRASPTGTARASLTWQLSARDFVQLSGNYSGPQLIAQGYRKPSGIVNVGYRRKIDDRFSLTFAGQNILDTAQQETVIDTPQLRDRLRQKGPGPILLFGLTWNPGANRRSRGLVSTRAQRHQLDDPADVAVDRYGLPPSSAGVRRIA